MDNHVKNFRKTHGKLPCRLCLRTYRQTDMEFIFKSGSELEDKIWSTVRVKVEMQDQITHICANCRNLVLVIDRFIIACQTSDALLAETIYVLPSDTWSIPDNVTSIKRVADLVEKHEFDIRALYNEICNNQDATEDVKQDNTFDDEDLDEIKEENHVEQEQEVAPDIDDESDETEQNVNTGSITTAHQSDDSKVDNVEKMVCSTCGKLVSQNALEGHMNRHLGLQPFECDFDGCNAKLHSKLALQQHRSRHKSTNRYYDCEVCDKKIKGTAYWLIHRKMHTEEPKFSCDICGKKFRRKCRLKMHSPVHTGVAEFPCEICGKYFTVKHNLRAHYKVHMRNGTYPAGTELLKPRKAKDTSHGSIT